MAIDIKFTLNESLFNRDPQETELGRKILKHSILLMNDIGFEAFTFRKLAAEIGSAERSIYRYFENKHLLLLFLTSWYWEWVDYLISINIKNIENPKRQLNIILEKIVAATSENPLTTYINENKLHRIIINEGSKSYHTYDVDDENKGGLFLSYKKLVEKVAAIIRKVNPKFKYEISLASNLFEMSNNQIYFAQHIPRLSSLKDPKNVEKDLIKMMSVFVDKILA